MPRPLPRHCPAVTIERLGGLGDGMASLDGHPLLVPKTVAGDRADIRVESFSSGQYFGRVERLIDESETRRASPCPHDARCGGCAIQQLSEEAYRTFKEATLTHALRKAGFMPGEGNAPVVFLPAPSRRRAEFLLVADEAGFRPAFAQARSHAPEALSTCLILAPSLHRFLFERRALDSLPSGTPLTRLQLTLCDAGRIDAVFTSPDPSRAAPALLACAETFGAARISIRSGESAPRILWENGLPLTLTCGQYPLPLPPGAFVQASREGQDAIAACLHGAVPQGAQLLDLFAGAGTWSFALADKAARIHAVEGSKPQTDALIHAAHSRRLAHITAAMRDLFKNPLRKEELNRFDIALLNPPRAGAKEQVGEITRSKLPRVVMVSCNPATFARDANALRHAGFRLMRATGIDQFVWSAHLEIVAAFER